MRVIVAVILGILLLAAATPVFAQQGPAAIGPVLPQISVGFGQADSPQQLSTALKVMLLLTVLSLVPSFLIMVTSFTRIAVVLAFLRQALGTNQTPTNQIILGLSLFLTVFIMFPVWQDINDNAYKPYLAEEIGYDEAIGNAIEPLRSFMLVHTREKDLGLFLKISRQPKPMTSADVPVYAVIPAFVISELRTAFTIGFLIWLPFLIVDIVIASVLMSMGMFMLPPIMISLPFKLLVFVLADGWFLLIGSLVASFNV
jgi:flagellar biosynthesis protein FliP